MDINKINVVYWEGSKLRKEYESSLGPERASKKIEVITYKLLESIRRKDIDAFCQNLIRAFLEVEKPIPDVFKDVLTDKAFNRIAYAFVMGLNGRIKGDTQS
ncbi:type I-B CRISPR-associated protein Cas8b1/Cst1 [Thermocrinis minervae]|uniref:CRISPR-associated protein Cas8b1/Cst1, subtype I-B/TNEAP n=1 Tax=Thermocrinis minervae TaxID=381751 RepID=A0A1M6Q5D3_9AQUI|nr:type I-B CRISPR-associated protein Cas8b1/Cst1 [Thermocrinis minervae]SHK15360.1 CRISPR-associated protein Cas8b1/Cst1, subtype I-B/TNEAP [Thermocrinis minervae]